jgi:hypothetical protein
LAAIPAENQGTSHTVDLNKYAPPVEYLLGMVWDLNSDSYGTRIKSIPTVTTKRELFSAISLKFDHHGICLPALTGAKLLYQNTQKLAKATPGVVGGNSLYQSKFCQSGSNGPPASKNCALFL